MANIGVSDIREFFQTHKDIDAVEDVLIFQWLTAINTESYKVLYDVFPDKYATTTDISVVSGTNSYALPTDFKTIDPQGCGVYILENGVITKELKYTGFGSSEEGFYLDGINIILTPLPDTAQTITIRYVPSIDNITADSDTLTVPQGYEDLINEELYVKYDKREEEDVGLISLSQNFAEDFRQRLIKNEKPRTIKTIRVKL